MTTYRSGTGIPATAPTWRRVAAYAIDLLIVLTLFALLVFWQLPSVIPHDAKALDLAPDVFTTLLFVLPATLVYFTGFELWNGQTPGKRFLRLRVRTLQGGRARFMECFLRNLLRLLWEAPVVGLFFFVADLVCIEWSEMEQRIGDLAAGTIVVYEPPAPS